MDTLDDRMLMIRGSVQEMEDNIAYIRKELPTLEMPDEIRAAVVGMCDGLDSTFNDTSREIVTLHGELSRHLGEEPLDTDAGDADPGVRMSSIIADLREEFEAMHRVVTQLDSARETDSSIGTVYVLVTESGGNILTAFVRIRDVLAAIAADLADGR